MAPLAAEDAIARAATGKLQAQAWQPFVHLWVPLPPR